MKNIDTEYSPEGSPCHVPDAGIHTASSPSAKAGTADKRPLDLPSHEVLVKLAQEDPAAYEVLRSELTGRFIASAPARLTARLAGIQFRIDGERRLSRSPLGSATRIYRLMWDSFLNLNRTWQEVVRLKEDRGHVLQQGLAAVSASPKDSAQILMFRRPSPGDRPAGQTVCE